MLVESLPIFRNSGGNIHLLRDMAIKKLLFFKFFSVKQYSCHMLSLYKLAPLCTCPERWHQKEKPRTHTSSSSSVTCPLTSIKQVKVNLLRLALYSLNHSEPEHFGQNVYLLLASFSKCLIQDTMASYCLHSAWV